MSSTTTGKQLIEGAIRILKGNVYRPTNADYGVALIALNDLLASWSADQILVPVVSADSFTLVPSTASYTIGSGGVVNTAWPIKLLEGMYIRDSGGLDHPVYPMSRLEYDSIYDKDSANRPTRVWYKSSYPLGILYFNSAPSEAETVYFESLKPMTSIADITATFALPPQYRKALRYNLAIELYLEFPDVTTLDVIGVLAKESKNALERVNTASELQEADIMLFPRRGMSLAEFNAGL